MDLSKLKEALFPSSESLRHKKTFKRNKQDMQLCFPMLRVLSARSCDAHCIISIFHVAPFSKTIIVGENYNSDKMKYFSDFFF